MLKLMTLLTFILISPLAIASDEVDHDPGACPDLTGKYLLPDPVFRPLKWELTSSFENKSAPTLSIRNEEDGSEDLIVLDGQRKETGEAISFRAACAGQMVFVYERNKENLSVSTMELDAENNLVLIIAQTGQEKIRQIGYRQ
jgi:hypothetical protein